MYKFVALILVANFELGELASERACFLKTTLGDIKGKTFYLPSGKAIEAYRGIPYAKPPIGHLRFKHPVIAEPWVGTLDATEYGYTCLQNIPKGINLPAIERLLPKTKLNEDCLTLNVFVPYPRPYSSSVMVFIHGGGFSMGGTSAPIYDGATLAGEENLIVISMNYRLASLGFLYLDHPDIQPNCGLMDQVLALSWVHKNIADFGGNPKEVTVFGNSAGAISIGFHMASPLSKGFFKRAILQSGTSFANLQLQEKHQNSLVTYKTADRLGCPEKTGSQNEPIARCLMKAKGMDLIKFEPPSPLPINFLPVYDEKFFIGHPIKLNENKQIYRKMDIMAGTVSNEGSLFLALMKPIVFVPVFDKVAPYHEEVFDAVKIHLLPNQSEVIYKTIELLYTDWNRFNDSEATLKTADSILSDYVFNCPLRRFLKLYSNLGTNVYAYSFEYQSPSTGLPKWAGVPHTEELRYVMGDVFKCGDRYSEMEKEYSSRIMRYWANFARTGNPNVSPRGKYVTEWIDWPRYEAKNPEALVLHPEKYETQKLSENSRCVFWNQLLPYLQKINLN